MQEPQQIQRGLGSLQDPRQNYGLGKLVKKAVRGVKKIVKSPLGKAAILGGLGMYGMGMGPFAGGSSMFGGKLAGMKGAGFLKGIMAGRTLPPSMGFKKTGFFGNMLGGAKNWWGGLSGGQKLFTGLAGASLAAPFLMKGGEEEEEDEESWTQIPSSIADIRNQARAHYTNPSASTLSFMPGKQFIKENFYAADGGRVGLLGGGEAGQEQMEQMLMAEFVKYKNQGGTLTFEQFVQAIMQQQQEQQQGGGMEQPQEVAMAANGGRIGFFQGALADTKEGKAMSPGTSASGGTHEGGYGRDDVPLGNQNVVVNNQPPVNPVSDNYPNVGPLFNTELVNRKIALDRALANYDLNNVVEDEEGQNINTTGVTQDTINTLFNPDVAANINQLKTQTSELLNADPDLKASLGMAQGGRIGAYKGGLLDEEDETTYNPYKAMSMYKNRPGKQEGGIMETEEASEMIDMGGQEKDYRETGGFVELGGKERADDVPARLSKNEFVFTADAVRAAGGGDIDAGSEVMQNMMDNLEQGGEISEESQGLEGAQAMYDQQQMLQSRIA